MNTDTWTRAALGSVVDQWIVGSTPPRTDPACYTQEGGAPWAKAEDVKGGLLLDTVEHVSAAGAKQLQRIRKGAVLVTTAGTIGRTAVTGVPMYCNQAVQALSFREEKVLPWFGCYYLQYRRPVLIRLANGVNIPYISKRKLQQVEIRYPSLHVQQRLVGYMQLAEALCQKAAELRTLTEKFLRSATVREWSRARRYAYLDELLEGPPQSGLRTKTSDEGKGIPVVSGFDGAERRLTSLEGCRRAQISPTYAVRFGLQPGDILLRSAVGKAGSRGTLVGELPEAALVGGSLFRLRPRRRETSPWLLAWLLGPGGDRLYADGKLQRRHLEELQVPVIRDERAFGQVFDLYAALARRAEQFAEGAQALYDSMLYRLFGGGTGNAFYGGGAEGREDAAGLTQAMRQFLKQMSRFQQELYETLVVSGAEQPVHALLKQMGPGSARAEGIQDALSTMALLERFGFVERESGRIPALSNGTADSVEYVKDHNGQYITIDRYKLREEDVYAPGADGGQEL